MIEWVLFDISVLYNTLQFHLEKVRPAKVIHIFKTALDMLQENFSWIKGVAEFALTRH